MTMIEGAAQVIAYLTGAGIVGLVVAVWRLYGALAAFKLHVAESYMKQDGLKEIKDEVREIRGVVFSIAGKLGIPIGGAA